MKNLKNVIFVITYTVLLVFCIFNLKIFSVFMAQFGAIISPFIIGFALAYILNIPYNYIQYKIFKVRRNDPKIKQKRIIALILTYILFSLIIVSACFTIIPQLASSIADFINNISKYYDQLNVFVIDLAEKFNLDYQLFETIFAGIKDYSSQILKTLSTLIPSIVNFATNTAQGIFNVICALIVSIYLLYGKESLITLVKKTFKVFFKENVNQFLSKVIQLTNTTFKGYIVSRFIDSLIVWIIAFICCLIFKFPYPVLLSFIIGITNVIPVIGPFIGAIPCAFIVLMAAPGKTILFLIFILILQQIDGNVIGPKVTSNSIGFDGIWVLFAVIVGGGFFGMVGVILSVPLFAVFFTLYQEYLKHRLNEQ